MRMTIRNQPPPDGPSHRQNEGRDAASATRAAGPHGRTTRDVRDLEASGTLVTNPRD